MRTNLYIEFEGNKISTKDIENKFKDIWREEGRLIKDINEVSFYYKPDEGACYYVVNGEEESGKIAL